MKARFLGCIRGGKSAAFVVTVPLLAILLLLLCSTAIADGGGGNPKDSIPVKSYSPPGSTSILSPSSYSVAAVRSTDFTAHPKTASPIALTSWEVYWRRYLLLYWIKL